jgi:hypothetical protein
MLLTFLAMLPTALPHNLGILSAARVRCGSTRNTCAGSLEE